MSYANGTTHYNLPQTTGTDKRDWSDTNQAFQDIDAALYGAVQDNAQAALDIEALEVRMDTAEQNIATNAGDIAALDGRVTTVEGTVAQHTTQIGDVRTDLEDMICAYNEASATSTHTYAVGAYFIYNDVLYRAIQAIAIGDTIVPDTNCTTTNVTTEIGNVKPVIVSRITSDGLKTFAQICNELMATFTANNIVETRPLSLLQISPNGNYVYFRATRASSDSIAFNFISTDTAGTEYRSLILIARSISDCKVIDVNTPLNGTATLADNSSAVASADTVFVLFY